jgi:hypothetical protein
MFTVIRVPRTMFCVLYPVSSSRRPDRFWGPPNLLYNGYQGVKRPGREADHSPAASVEIKKMWIYTSTSPYDFMAWYLIS